MKPKVHKATTKTLVDSHGRPLRSKPKYDSIQSIQEAINMAIAENRVVRFQTEKTNTQLKTEIIDLKNCSLRKPFKEAKEVAVIPAGIEDFCFEEEVDSSIVLVRNIL